jgi:hypothetical protein
MKQIDKLKCYNKEELHISKNKFNFSTLKNKFFHVESYLKWPYVVVFGIVPYLVSNKKCKINLIL